MAWQHIQHQEPNKTPYPPGLVLKLVLVGVVWFQGVVGAVQPHPVTPQPRALVGPWATMECGWCKLGAETEMEMSC